MRDGGHGSIGRLYKHLSPEVCEYSYGWAGLLGLAWANRRAIRGLLERIQPGDSIVAHSNGCLIAWQIAQIIPLKSVVCINPALRRDARWPNNTRVLCIHNSEDWIVNLGRIWGRLFQNDGIQAQGWGAAGRYGFTSSQDNVDNIDSAMDWWEKPVHGHSALFTEDMYWGGLINRWIRSVSADPGE